MGPKEKKKRKKEIINGEPKARNILNGNLVLGMKGDNLEMWRKQLKTLRHKKEDSVSI